ncbi:TetR/AcrR family transcriptional regulator [Paenibacillus terrae]|uniref:TetR family transcriptional regulator n=1 Tax=Paenibacillus terrae TaxID=159743 RepID=A0A0D7WVW2_9BACL|nr:TetR/AcrR family transcriptional regulator [Paenibacillus terrae]KJD43134.1 TetR family transcriptional regulator [Paenibacillus terrae]
MSRNKEFDETKVLDKAMQLFWEQGYEKTSMSDLVEHMGIHRRSLYDTFGDKHTLFLKAMDRYESKVNASLTRGVKRSKTATEAPLQFIVGILICGETDSPSGCLMVNSAVELAVGDADVNKKSTEAFTTEEQLLKEIIFWGQRDGEFSSDYDAGELAEYLHNVGVGLRSMARTSIPREKLHRIANISMQLLEK